MNHPPIVDRIREVARLHGWAITEHGTMVRDIDLLAVPWIQDASPYAAVANAIERVCGLEIIGDVTNKPHGRRALTYQQPGAQMVAILYRDGRRSTGKVQYDPPHIDLSFIDPRDLGA